MNNQQKSIQAKIYRIVCNDTNLTYYGSTTQKLSQRLSCHVNQYKNGRGITSSKIIENGNYSIILVKNIECQSREELKREERWFIENNECVNKNIPGRLKQESYKAWRCRNIENEKVRHKLYRALKKNNISVETQ